MTPAATPLRQDIHETRYSEAERAARIDLAAAYRAAAAYGWSNLIYNHIALRVPGEPEHFLFKPHELMFEEVTASCLLKVDLSGNSADGTGRKPHPGFTIHASVLQARPDVQCVVHVHPEEGIAMAAHGGGLKPISQDSMHFYNRIGYNDYDGQASPTDQRKKMVTDLGPHWALILRNHGLLTCANSAALAVMLMKYLVMSCRTQLMLEASGAPVVIPPAEVCEAAAKRWDAQYAKAHPTAEWASILRMLDRVNPGYRD
jgi:ribulose-5-phosphate 4-epimerase/fuculose-1-phosphate aldolase